MTRVKNIETLSLLFTAGVGLGALLSPGNAWLLCAALFPLLCMPILLRERLTLARERVAIPAVLATFLVLGLFCSLQARLPAVEGTSALMSLAGRAAVLLRSRIDAIPFGADISAPLLKALLTGDRSGLPAGTVVVFRASGASHLLALSGLHIGIIYLIFDRLSRPMGQSLPVRVVRYCLIVLGGGFFTLMTGGAPSTVRAFLFILINETLRLACRERKPSRVLCLALLVQLVIDPGTIGSVGFQLSYLAMAGIFLVYPFLERIYPESGPLDPFRRIWKSVSLALSCQVFTAPLSWHYFHSFPRHFLLTNLLAIPVTTALLGLGIVTVSLSVAGACPQLLITATDALCRLLLRILEVISGM